VTGIRRQGKLRYEQKISLDLSQTQIHLASFIGENPVTQQTLDEFGRTRLIVLGFDADEHQQTAADGGMRRAGDLDTGTSDALQERDHGPTRPIASRGDMPDFWVGNTTESPNFGRLIISYPTQAK
jgi:hypothetical protein